MAVSSTTSYGATLSAIGTGLAITGIALPSWTSSTVGDASVTAGLFSICSINVPFLLDGCDGILEPSTSLIGVRVLSILQCVIGFFAVLSGVLTVVLLPGSGMLLTTLIVTLIGLACGVLAVIAFASGANPIVMESAVAGYSTSFLIFNLGWIMFLFAAAFTLHAYVVKLREPDPANIHRKGWKSVQRAGRAVGRAAGGRR